MSSGVISTLEMVQRRTADGLFIEGVPRSQDVAPRAPNPALPSLRAVCILALTVSPREVSVTQASHHVVRSPFRPFDGGCIQRSLL